jgi:hypothetical protein
MPTLQRIAVLIADMTALAYEPLFRDALAQRVPNALIQTMPISSAAERVGRSFLALHALRLAQMADVVYVLAPEAGTLTNAILIELRERAGFLQHDGAFRGAAHWRSRSGRRALVVVNTLPSTAAVTVRSS